MTKVLVVVLVMVTLSLLAGLAIPAFAHWPEDREAPSADQEAWEAMHEACEEGDWEAMAEAAEEVHGEDFSSMPCHDKGYYAPEEENPPSTNRWGGMMGRGMMGW